MLANSLLFLVSATLALASPCVRTSPTLPVNGGDKELSSPPTGVTLKRIALGFGIQNYTCASAGSTAAATGALAMLYDITSLYPGTGRKSLDTDAWAGLSATALNGHAVPLNLLTDGPGADAANPFPANAALKLTGVPDLPFLGHHYFNAAGIPTFALSSGTLVGKKLDAVNAPASADPGPDGTGAVAWLYLGDAGGSTGGLQYVYRVLTAGGNAHGCTAAGKDSTSYATTYWFFG
ncbi:hypothetical protein AK830_g7489 [Neonectria ditissima]|uniref:Malate dehydrogenase n=1 Tax=Neonectria ditissima TaxID=78410 RepID=A0A0P7BDN7_9HYPO|nr:hypothetical protein AK830_g7489 [Neonectria ditissima]